MIVHNLPIVIDCYYHHQSSWFYLYLWRKLMIIQKNSTRRMKEKAWISISCLLRRGYKKCMRVHPMMRMLSYIGLPQLSGTTRHSRKDKKSLSVLAVSFQSIPSNFLSQSRQPQPLTLMEKCNSLSWIQAHLCSLLSSRWQLSTWVCSSLFLAYTLLIRVFLLKNTVGFLRKIVVIHGLSNFLQ